MNNKIKQIKNNLLLNEENLLNLWNEFTTETNCGDGEIYTSIEQLAEVFDGDDLAEFASRVYFGEVGSWLDPYWAVNAYGHIKSFCNLLDPKSPIDLDELATWLAEKEE